jgi:hypothetical protein
MCRVPSPAKTTPVIPITVTILGNGTVFYIGDPFVDSDITGSGSVQQIPG